MGMIYLYSVHGAINISFLLFMVGAVRVRCSHGSCPAVFVSSKDCYNARKESAPGTSASLRTHNKVASDFGCHINHYARYGTAEEGTRSV